MLAKATPRPAGSRVGSAETAPGRRQSGGNNAQRAGNSFRPLPGRPNSARRAQAVDNFPQCGMPYHGFSRQVRWIRTCATTDSGGGRPFGCDCAFSYLTVSHDLFSRQSLGLYRFLGIAVLLDVRDIPQVGPLHRGADQPTLRFSCEPFPAAKPRQLSSIARITGLRPSFEFFQFCSVKVAKGR
jgi:hypothetical protein